jgi:hypothetical protein
VFVYSVNDLLKRRRDLRISPHALLKARKSGLQGKDILYAIFNGEIIERYPDRNRVLILGPVKGHDLNLHVVCDYGDGDEVVAVTIYVPYLTRWFGDVTRRR